MPDVIPQIEKGKTTRADLIGKLGDPTSQSRDSEGNETLMFIEKAAIWEGGAWGFVKSRPIQSANADSSIEKWGRDKLYNKRNLPKYSDAKISVPIT
jgi:hypothetical protein